MADKLKPHPASRLGEYHVHTDIAEGTFGKVKSEYNSLTFERQKNFDETFVSGYPYNHWSQSRYEVHFQSRHSYDENKDTGPARGGIHADSTSSSYHQAVRSLFFTAGS